MNIADIPAMDIDFDEADEPRHRPQLTPADLPCAPSRRS